MKTERSDKETANSISNLYTERISAIQEFQQKYKSPRLVLKQLKSNKTREEQQEYLHSSIQELPKSKRFITPQRVPKQNLTTEQQEKYNFYYDMQNSMRKIAQISNDDNRMSLKHLKNMDNDHAKLTIKNYIMHSTKQVKKKILKLNEYEKSAPFRLEQISYFEKVLPKMKMIRQEVGMDDDTLTRNRLVLEKILLERMMLK